VQAGIVGFADDYTSFTYPRRRSYRPTVDEILEFLAG
jgi:hypothetical protein